ncbi:Protein phosphatase 2C 4 [Rhodotorula toruloides]|nr:Protein phosphatase 2C 4 [Rhodotorula toruloides]
MLSARCCCPSISLHRTSALRSLSVAASPPHRLAQPRRRPLERLTGAQWRVQDGVRSLASVGGQSRGYSDDQHFRTQHGSIRVNLKSKQAVGVAQSRGERPYQEDAYSVHSLALPQSMLRWNVVDDRLGTGWTPQNLEGFDGEVREGEEERRRQVAYFGVFDGHGGDLISRYLRDTLPTLLESTTASEIPALIDQYRELGGYLKRYRGGPLDRFRKGSEAFSEWRGMGLDELAVLAFLKADNHVVHSPELEKGGSTATVAFLHSLDLPYSLPFYASSLLSLTIAHLGDTSALLCSTHSGRVRRFTEAHHADSRTESERLRTSGTGIITDSFGESRWGGVVANTRAIGDREFKPVGVIGEPEIVKRVIKGDEFASLILCSDGITDTLSDQEIVDLTRGIRDPTRAASKIVSFAEDCGAEDNLTCLVVPLPGYLKMGGLDTTASRREYRLRGADGASRRQKRM